MSKSRVKRLAAQMVETPPEKLVEIIDRQMTEISRLTAALADAERRLELWATAGNGERYKLEIGDMDGIGCRNETIKLLDARIAALESHQRWVAVSESKPTDDEVEIAFWDGTLMCRIFGAWDAREGAWYAGGEPLEGSGVEVVAWRPCGDLPARSEGA